MLRLILKPNQNSAERAIPPEHGVQYKSVDICDEATQRVEATVACWLFRTEPGFEGLSRGETVTVDLTVVEPEGEAAIMSDAEISLEKQIAAACSRAAVSGEQKDVDEYLRLKRVQDGTEGPT